MRLDLHGLSSLQELVLLGTSPFYPLGPCPSGFQLKPALIVVLTFMPCPPACGWVMLSTSRYDTPVMQTSRQRLSSDGNQIAGLIRGVGKGVKK